MRIHKPLVWLTLGLMLAIYIGSYFYLSRRLYAEADRYEMVGFYYFFPEDTGFWRYKNFSCVVLFWPLNFVDRSLGCGRCPGAEPFWKLSHGCRNELGF